MARTYADRCGIARALDVVGERWALLIVRELMLGPKRFTDLRAGLPRVAPDVLAQRLRELEEEGVVERSTLPPPAASKVYALTEQGRALEPVLLALGRWGSRRPARVAGAPLSPDAFALALPTLFRGSGEDVTVELQLGEHAFTVAVAGGELDVRRGAAEQAEARIVADHETLAGVLWHGRPLGDVRIEGSRAAARRFLRLFPRPG